MLSADQATQPGNAPLLKLLKQMATEKAIRSCHQNAV
jgi:hypothetical protein